MTPELSWTHSLDFMNIEVLASFCYPGCLSWNNISFFANVMWTEKQFWYQLTSFNRILLFYDPETILNWLPAFI